MEPANRLAEIKLVSKYYPVANYSYPRKDDTTAPTHVAHSQPRTHKDRTSVGSESSAPGLVEDRTDSEVSQEDDYQYHAHTTELWDSFWRPGGEWRLEAQQQQHQLLRQQQDPKKDYPALLPESPRHKRQPSQKSEGSVSPSWPLPDSFPVEQRPRKAAATYSAFPSRKNSVKAAPPPPPQPPAQRHIANGQPPLRPPRPNQTLLTPCLQQPASVPVTFATPPEAAAPRPPEAPPKSPLRHKKSASREAATVRLTKSMDGRPEDANPFGIHTAASRSSTDLTPRDLDKQAANKSQHRAPRHYKSTTHLAAARQQYQMMQKQHELELQRQSEPHSVFEDDSDCEEDAGHGKSFFRFHKRSGSSTDSRTKTADGPVAVIRKRRGRADTIPSLPTFKQAPQQQQQQQPDRERKVDVFGRIIGRRSR
ncbi:hypothetical protein K4F52_002812 [Lecanicillium sp. MT-2017a]|nr:hypothetical protein K4F52_002812 [Lecanicillium sp. MT-2017a]